MVNNSTNINKNHLSPKLIEWWSTIPPISTKITSHFNSLSDGQQFHQYQQKSPLTSTHWVMVNNSTNINKITSHHNSLSDVNNSTNINKNHLSHWVIQLIKWWSTIPLISTTITSHHNSLSDGQQFHSTNINKNHLSPLSDGQQFHQYQQKSTHWVMVNNFTNINKNHLSPSTHWVMVNNST